MLVMIIALIVYALIEYACKQEGLAKSAKQALFMFRMPAIVTLKVNGQIVQQIGNIKPFMLEILGALNVKPLELVGKTHCHSLMQLTSLYSYMTTFFST